MISQKYALAYWRAFSLLAFVAVVALARALLIAPASAQAQEVFRAHAIAMHGAPKYGADIAHLPYANPDAPKGGLMRTGTIGSFDHFNPFISEGHPFSVSFQSLIQNGEDEPFTMYASLAEEVEWPKDRTWVIFHLNPQARWHDGKPVTVDDVIFSYEKITTEGAPFYRYYYGSVQSVERVGERSVKFNFDTAAPNPELPLIMGQMPVVAKHDWEGHDFSKPRMDPPLASGPYRIADFSFGRRVVLERVEDWWAKDLPFNRGRHNFDEQWVEYFRDFTLLREVLKGGQLDFLAEIRAKSWAQDYEIDAVQDGFLRKQGFEVVQTHGMQGYLFNLRRSVFQDIRVRKAINLAFDFNWTNKVLLFDQYRHAQSYWNNSELGSRGLPEGEELEVLEQFRDRLPPEVFTKEFRLPETDGSGRVREQLREALALLKEVGWEIKERDGTPQLIHNESDEVFEFEILLVQSDFERLTLPFVKNLRQLGMKVSLRLIDTSQYLERLREYDFDMVVGSFPQSESPGNEQRAFWGSDAAVSPGSRNLVGISDPTIDALIELVISAEGRESLVARTRALDRVLLHGWYVVPQWFSGQSRLLWWDRYGMPEVNSISGPSVSFWWFDPDKETRLSENGFGQGGG